MFTLSGMEGGKGGAPVFGSTDLWCRLIGHCHHTETVPAAESGRERGDEEKELVDADPSLPVGWSGCCTGRVCAPFYPLPWVKGKWLQKFPGAHGLWVSLHSFPCCYAEKLLQPERQCSHPVGKALTLLCIPMPSGF